jgi:hypothetical protein
MKTAIAYCRGRVAPVLDTAGSLIILDSTSPGSGAEISVELQGEGPERVGRLVFMGVNRIICGAVSAFLGDLLVASGIEIVPFVAGDLEEIRTALRQGRDLRQDFSMPGCRRGCRRMEGKGQGAGRGGNGAGTSGGHGRMGGTGAGAGGVCRCPVCGSEVPHERGIPCNVRKCPDCGATMVRKA